MRVSQERSSSGVGNGHGFSDDLAIGLGGGHSLGNNEGFSFVANYRDEGYDLGKAANVDSFSDVEDFN